MTNLGRVVKLEGGTLNRVRILLPVISALLFLSVGLNLFFWKNFQKNTDETVASRVVDGDTFMNDKNVRMRLASVEAPELMFCGGIDAKERLRTLIEGKKIKIEVTGEDTFNRSVVLVWQNGELVNETLLREGLARYDGTKNSQRDRLRESYQKAVADKKGIFGLPCHSEQPEKIGCAVKGNLERQTKQKSYFLPNCPQYGQVIVERDLGEEWFCSEKEAKAAGFEKSANCMK